MALQRGITGAGKVASCNEKKKSQGVPKLASCPLNTLVPCLPLLSCGWQAGTLGLMSCCALVKRQLQLPQGCLRHGQPPACIFWFCVLLFKDWNYQVLQKNYGLACLYASVSCCDQGLSFGLGLSLSPQVYLTEWRCDCSMLACLNLAIRGNSSTGQQPIYKVSRDLVCVSQGMLTQQQLLAEKP